jgi:hypothetical protein
LPKGIWNALKLTSVTANRRSGREYNDAHELNLATLTVISE